MTSNQTLQKRFAAAFMPNYGVPPVAIIRGQGCRVTDADGREYLDLIAGIAVSSLGHAHPALVEAVSRQVAEVAHTSNLFLHEREIELAERLLALLAEDGRVFLANSGTEANEAAIKLVRRIQGPGRPVLVAAERSFHGRTLGSLAPTGKESIRTPFGPYGFEVRFVPYGDPDALRTAVGPDVAAVFLEPGLGESGVIPAPEGYLAAAREACDSAGALLVLDEIRAASAGPGCGSRTRRPASGPTCSPWPRAWAAGCRSGRASAWAPRAPAFPRATTAPPSAATRSPAPRPWPCWTPSSATACWRTSPRSASTWPRASARSATR